MKNKYFTISEKNKIIVHFNTKNEMIENYVYGEDRLFKQDKDGEIFEYKWDTDTGWLTYIGNIKDYKNIVDIL